MRRRSLALLALLACAEERGVAREQLLLYLWPESNTQRARNSLNQTVHAIRQQLGEDAIVGTTTLRLNPERVTCDLWDYRNALKRDDVATAVRLREGSCNACGERAVGHRRDWTPHTAMICSRLVPTET
jgi:DNA-binding SARP family transcriptional activator